jgi:hypothetical protein
MTIGIMQITCNANINVGAAKALSRKGELLAVPTQLINGETVQIYIRKQDLDKYRDAAVAQSPVTLAKELAHEYEKLDAKEVIEEIGFNFVGELHIP